jgi:hypothetical protein
MGEGVPGVLRQQGVQYEEGVSALDKDFLVDLLTEGEQGVQMMSKFPEQNCTPTCLPERNQGDGLERQRKQETSL